MKKFLRNSLVVLGLVGVASAASVLGQTADLNICVTLDSADKQEIILGISTRGNYQENIPDETGELIPNPVSREDYVENMMLLYLQNEIDAYVVDDENSKSKSTVNSRKDKLKGSIRK